MIYNKVYRGEFRNVQTDSDNLPDQKVIQVDIYDTASGPVGPSPEVIPLDMADSPVIISSIDNDEDKFTPVRGRQASINIHSSDTIGIETFILSGNNRFYVEISCQLQIKFRGFISTADVEEDFLPDPNVINLIATDGLNFLNDLPLVDAVGLTIKNEQTYLSLIQAALAQTGLSLNLRVNMNIREIGASTLNGDSDGSGHFFKFIYINTKTFESEINVLEDCLTVLSKMLSVGLYIQQWNGVWVVMTEDEYRIGGTCHFYEWDPDGVFVAKTTMELKKYIGISSPMNWLNEDCRISANQPCRSISTIYNYNYPAEIPCNKDFSRGVGPDPTGSFDETIDYVPECWDFLREGSTGGELDLFPFTGSVGVLRKRFEYNYEKERYYVVQTAGGFRHYFKSEAIFVNQGDKLTIGIDHRIDIDTSTTSLLVAHIRLLGDDATIWDWDYNQTTGVVSWIPKAPTDAVFDAGFRVDVTGLDNTEWRTVSSESLPMPVKGRLYIRLLSGFAPPRQMWFANLTLEYTAFVNGSFAKYTAQKHTVTQATTDRATREDEVFISDSINTLTKGALMKRGPAQQIYTGTADFSATNYFELPGDQRGIFKAGMTIFIFNSTDNDGETVTVSVDYSILLDLTTIVVTTATTLEVGATVIISVPTYILTDRFYDAAAFPDQDYPDITYEHPFGEIQSFWIFNQLNRVMRNFEGTIDGLQMDTTETDDGIPDGIYQFWFTDPNENSNNKIFQLLHFEQDYHLGQWTGFFSQVNNNDEPGKVYLGHSFKYISK